MHIQLYATARGAVAKFVATSVVNTRSSRSLGQCGTPPSTCAHTYVYKYDKHVYTYACVDDHNAHVTNMQITNTALLYHHKFWIERVRWRWQQAHSGQADACCKSCKGCATNVFSNNQFSVILQISQSTMRKSICNKPVASLAKHVAANAKCFNTSCTNVVEVRNVATTTKQNAKSAECGWRSHTHTHTYAHCMLRRAQIWFYCNFCFTTQQMLWHLLYLSVFACSNNAAFLFVKCVTTIEEFLIVEVRISWLKLIVTR